MYTIMNDTQIKTLEQIRQFLSGTLSVEFSIDSKDESYRWIERTLIRLDYRSRSKVGKGLVLDCYFPPQITNHRPF